MTKWKIIYVDKGYKRYLNLSCYCPNSHLSSSTSEGIYKGSEEGKGDIQAYWGGEVGAHNDTVHVSLLCGGLIPTVEGALTQKGVGTVYDNSKLFGQLRLFRTIFRQ